MVKKLVILGDSFCHGVGTASPFKNPKNIEYAFGKYIADYLNLEYINLAEPGISILKTVEIGHKYLEDNYKDVEKIIIGWTNPNRLGIYSTQSMLQILPSYICLGSNSDDDVFVEYDSNVKFVTNKDNKHHLAMLPELHKLIINNDFFNQTENSNIYISLFKSWIGGLNLNYDDFSVFGLVHDVSIPVNFSHVMVPNRHPTKEEQHKFAELLLNYIK